MTGKQFYLEINNTRLILDIYLLHRYVLRQFTDHRPGKSLSHIDLLHEQPVSVWNLLGRDYTSNT